MNFFYNMIRNSQLWIPKIMLSHNSFADNPDTFSDFKTSPSKNYPYFLTCLIHPPSLCYCDNSLMTRPRGRKNNDNQSIFGLYPTKAINSHESLFEQKPQTDEKQEIMFMCCADLFMYPFPILIFGKQSIVSQNGNWKSIRMTRPLVAVSRNENGSWLRKRRQH